ncbi:phosphoethanolamine transferase [Paragemmobacter ruber]|uniref:Phosphoethanolamine--lipid A transferase n=1 Tax=Paragemmobacter ruber TaxID=1985673 RepID=A0ABW9Y0V2_9RHOB|nr:phosphoethanolamine--lipid A transferase [Rhodobacter ruber]NBE06120.1 phosphoethanolamine--lipid A transferase [Rhodobacter ruber]
MSTIPDLLATLPLKADRPLGCPFPRPVIGSVPYSLAVTAFIMAADNQTFWRRSLEVFDGNLLQLAGWGGAVSMLTLLTLSLPGFRWLLRPMAAFLLILASVTSYFMDRLGIIIDREMIQNAMLTTMSESKHLMTWSFVAQVIIWGVLPAVVALWVRVRRGPLLGDTLRWGLTVAVTLAVFAGLLFSDFKAYSAVAREHKEVLASYQPGAALSGAVRYAKMMLKAKNVVVSPVGLDAHKGQRISTLAKPVLTVVFVGETARAQNFALNGYDRPTTPELERRGVINFTDVTSCGTSTAVSVPCMMSNLTRDGYSYNRSIRQENLIDVLHHADVDVLWWDNNTGDQGVAARITKARRMTAADDPEACVAGECTDAVFLGPLKQALPTITRDTVLFVHMIGSHGPSYYLRYPPSAEYFTPACRTAEFADCTVQEIVNAYDNSIRFTDTVIARTIDLLSAQTNIAPAVLYLSDHGESLGEDGLYLHAAPYFMAPATQTTVPMMMWLPDSYTSGLAVQRNCIEAKAGQSQSHDNLFHTVLGLMDIETEARDPSLDLISGCL